MHTVLFFEFVYITLFYVYFPGIVKGWFHVKEIQDASNMSDLSPTIPDN